MSKYLTTVYGPVNSWRYGRSLGIDPIGAISHCSFNCVYCQLGEIEHLGSERRVFVQTAQILKDLEIFAPWEVDTLTLSGSGEPTLALNLGEVLDKIKEITGKPTSVLTNGTMLSNLQVRKELCLADQVSVKLDAIDCEQLRRINRPVPTINLSEILTGIEQFSREYQGLLAIQTMVLVPWTDPVQEQYIKIVKNIAPREIQLNTPSRPKPLQRQLAGRGNHTGNCAYPVQQLKCLSREVLAALSDRLTQATNIPVRYPPSFNA